MRSLLADSMPRRYRVCLVTPGYIASTPRVVREADALAEAGHNVRVVFTQGQLESIRAFDEEVLAQRMWRWAAFRWSDRHSEERWEYVKSGVRHRLAQALPAPMWGVPGIVERAEGRVFPELARLASAEAADCYIGHYPAGLAAAAVAAARRGAVLGYDIEDLYTETFPDTPAWAPSRARIERLERRYVPACRYISAVSRPVADAFAARYRTAPPVVVHNSHAWSDRERLDGRIIDRRGPALSLYWYSQTVGLDRGIQDAIKAASLLNPRPQIHLRGAVSRDVRDALSGLAIECGAGDVVLFHDPCRPADLLSRAAEHDVGLALEYDNALNRQLTVTNKVLLYLTAGLAVAATDTAGQRSVLDTCADAGRLYPRRDWRALADQLAEWTRNPGALSAAKQAALGAARATWNWERESAKVLEGVDRALDGTPRLAECS